LKLTLREQANNLAIIGEAFSHFDQTWTKEQNLCYRQTFKAIKPFFESHSQAHAFLRSLAAFWQWRISKHRTNVEQELQLTQTNFWKGDRKRQGNIQRRATYTVKAANSMIDVLLWHLMVIDGREKFSRKTYRPLVPYLFHFNILFSKRENEVLSIKQQILDAESDIFPKLRKRIERFSEHPEEDIRYACQAVMEKVYRTFEL